MKLYLYGDEEDNETMSQDELESLLIGVAARRSVEQHKEFSAWPQIVQLDALEVGESLELGRWVEAKRIK